jgi:hypothetical protein
MPDTSEWNLALEKAISERTAEIDRQRAATERAAAKREHQTRLFRDAVVFLEAKAEAIAADIVIRVTITDQSKIEISAKDDNFADHWLSQGTFSFGGEIGPGQFYEHVYDRKNAIGQHPDDVWQRILPKLAKLVAQKRVKAA